MKNTSRISRIRRLTVPCSWIMSRTRNGRKDVLGTFGRTTGDDGRHDCGDKKLQTRSGSFMAFVTVEDMYGTVECVCFPNIRSRQVFSR
ncbi:MAG: hypothetical protein ACLRSW_16450 [Christensenellaceae bacterium]